MTTEIETFNNGANREQFLTGVEVLFPESFAKIEDIEDGLLHLEMADFSRTTMEAIKCGQTELVLAHLNFISGLFNRANSDLENAIYVSYLENIFLGELDREVEAARLLLPENLVIALTDLEKHFENLKNDPN